MKKKVDIKVTVLGTGTCVPSLRRSSCSVMAESGNLKIVLGAGPGTMRRLLETGTGIHEIDCLFFSHFHPDHCAELVPFLFANKYPEPSRRSKPLTIGGGPGFANYYRSLVDVHGEWIRLDDGLLKILEMERHESPVDMGPVRLRTAPMNHRPESIAFKITGPGGSSFVYSGDTDYNDELVSLAFWVDLFICESAVPDDNKVPGHLTPSLAGEIASRAQVFHLVPTHFYPECDRINIEKQIRKTYNGGFTIAEDLMVFRLPF